MFGNKARYTTSIQHCTEGSRNNLEGSRNGQNQKRKNKEKNYERRNKTVLIFS